MTGQGLAEVDQRCLAVLVVIPGQQTRQAGQRGQGGEQGHALAFGQVEWIAQSQEQHLLVEAAQRAGGGRLERCGDRLVQALLVLTQPVQQVAVAPQRGWWLLVQLVVTQQALGEEVLGHVQAPGQVRARGLTSLQDLQQQALEAGGQLVAEMHEQGRGSRTLAQRGAVVAVFLAEALQGALSFQ